MSRSREVLPLPEGPSTARKPPSGTSRLTRSRARIGRPFRPGCSFTTCWSTIRDMARAGSLPVPRPGCRGRTRMARALSHGQADPGRVPARSRPFPGQRQRLRPQPRRQTALKAALRCLEPPAAERGPGKGPVPKGTAPNPTGGIGAEQSGTGMRIGRDRKLETALTRKTPERGDPNRAGAGPLTSRRLPSPSPRWHPCPRACGDRSAWRGGHRPGVRLQSYRRGESGWGKCARRPRRS